MALKISIIIPCYNVEKYIERCLLSVVTQDIPHSDYEIIAINDGSTDETLDLMKEFAMKYSNIRIVDKKNEGLSATRNCGLDISCGEYIIFLDSDDWIAENCLKTIYDKAHNDRLDILECDFKNVDENGNNLKNKASRFEECRVVDGREYILAQKAILPMVWTRIYRRDFLIENSLRMALIRHEDEEFTPRALYLAKRIEYFSFPFYFYVTREGSITTTYRDQNYFDIITAMGNLNKFVGDQILSNDVELIGFFNRHIARILLMIFKRSIRDRRPFQSEMIAEMKRLNIYPLKGAQSKFYVILLNFSWQLFIKYYKFKLQMRGKRS